MLYAALIAMATGFLVGKVRGGSLERLARLRVRLLWLALCAWMLQLALFISPLAPVLDPWAAPIHLASVALLALVIAANWRTPGLALLGLGLALNALVYAFNGGFMPVSDTALVAAGNEQRLDAMRSGERLQKTFLMHGTNTPLWFLGDLVPVAPLGKIYSPGDFVAAAGVLVLVAGGMGARQQREPRPVVAAREQEQPAV